MRDFKGYEACGILVKNGPESDACMHHSDPRPYSTPTVLAVLSKTYICKDLGATCSPWVQCAHPPGHFIIVEIALFYLRSVYYDVIVLYY